MTDFEPSPLWYPRLFLQQVSPYPKALDMELLQWGSGHARTRMKANRRTTRTLDDQRVHPLALVGLLDHSFSFALSGVVSAHVGMSTFDLRIGFPATPPTAGDITVDTNAIMVDEKSATVTAQARDATGATVAFGTALFRIGDFPGGAAPAFEAIGGFDPEPLPGPMLATLALRGEKGSPILSAGNPAVIGWESGGVLHGGAIGAVLMAACEDRADLEGLTPGQHLASLNIRYLRPALGAMDLCATSSIVRKGSAGSFVAATCHHEPGRTVAHAEATYSA